MNLRILLAWLFSSSLINTFSQQTNAPVVIFSPETLAVERIVVNGTEIRMNPPLTLFTFIVDSVPVSSVEFFRDEASTQIVFQGTDSLFVTLSGDTTIPYGSKFILRFTNRSTRNHSIENLVPFGESPDKVFITASGSKEWPQYLCRSKLFRPGFGPVGVVLPDNAWHLGFTDFNLTESTSITSLARRTKRDPDHSKVDRWAITLKPGGWVEYSLWIDTHQGDWHNGLKMMFQDRWLYDLDSFDQTLFKRVDLKWMQSSWLMLLQFAWDKQYYDFASRKHTFYADFFAYDSLTGGWDIFTLWPTWPRLGLDQRNQWDMYRDLPGGIPELRRQADFLHQKGRRYFISYNPWDESGRKEDHLTGMEQLLRQIDADGVVLDTRGESSRELQAAADRVKPGIIMYSEGMAVPKDMPGIVSGRVHDALWMPPPLNLNKLIKPDFAIFRVLQLADDRIHRELAVAFFNGYGVEVNTMRPGRPDWIAEDFSYMGRTTKILRENDGVFHNDKWLPLVPALVDSVYINRWESGGKILFTILSLRPEGFSGELFLTDDPLPSYTMQPGNLSFHWVDLWNHKEFHPTRKAGRLSVPVNLEPFDRSWLNSRREGQNGCVALFPDLMKVHRTLDSIVVSASAGNRLVICAGNPAYANCFRTRS